MAHRGIIFNSTSDEGHDNFPKPLCGVNHEGYSVYTNFAYQQLLDQAQELVSGDRPLAAQSYITEQGWSTLQGLLDTKGSICYTTAWQGSESIYSVWAWTQSMADQIIYLFLLLDVSDWANQIQQLKIRERQFCAFFENSSTDINLKDKEGRYIMVSRQFERHVGLAHGTAEGRLPQDIFEPAFAAHVRAHDLAVMEGGTLVNQEDHIPQADGSTIDLLVSKFPIVAPGGELEGLGVIATDITYLKQIERELRLEEQRFRDFAHAAADYFWELDEQLRFCYLSEGFQTITGVKPEHLIGASMEEFFTQHTIPSPTIEVLREHLSKAQAFEQLPIEIRRRDGKHCIVRHTGQPRYNEQGQWIGFRGAASDITALHQLNKQLAYQANHDHLTGLINRRGFEAALNNDLSHQHYQVNTLVYFDLDQFKVINDTCGHEAGDGMLQEIAQLLGQQVRCQDMIARLGGDEFALWLRNCNSAPAQHIAEKIRLAVAAYRFRYHERLFSITCSMGLVSTDQQQYRSRIELMQAADIACYMAKEQGRNQVCVYQATEQTWQHRTQEMYRLTTLQEVLEKNRLVLYYQPIKPCQLPSERLMGEVLLRFLGSGDQICSPTPMLQAAERFGQMIKIDRWVIEQLYQAIASKMLVLEAQQQIMVNLSVSSLDDALFREYLLAFLQAFPDKAHHWVFELTETAVISCLDVACEFMTQMKQWGCQFALDDFGAGMAPFQYLKVLPFDYIKIDGQFIRTLTVDSLDYIIVESIVRMAKHQGLRTVAEHVECQSTVGLLQQLQVDYMQGFALASPRPLKDAFLAENDIEGV